MIIDIAAHERGILIAGGAPVRYLRPGRHFVFQPFRTVELRRLKTDALVVELDAEELALVPPEDLTVLTVAPHERALVGRRGKPALWLQPGQHLVWTVDRVPRGPAAGRPAVTIEVIDTSAIAVAPLRDEVRALVPDRDYVEVTAAAGTVALRYVDGVLEDVLGPGRHAAWTTTRKVQLAVIDLRERLLHVVGQEVLTRDRVSIRLNLSAAIKVVDARLLATVARAPDDVLYLAMQLSARQAVAKSSLDELLADREALSGAIAHEVAGRAASVGLALLELGVKDVILPGEMKTLLNRVIEAQKEAEANVILRREETAATRSLAQTARVLAENPLVVRLKELEAYKDLAAKVGQVHLVLGQAALPSLQLAAPEK